MIMIETKWENMSIVIVEYLQLTKTKIPIISFWNNSYAIKNDQTDSSLDSFKNIN